MMLEFVLCLCAGREAGELSAEAVRVVVAGARWERAATPAGAAELERRLFACAAPQHRLLPRLLHLLLAPHTPSASAPHATSSPPHPVTLMELREFLIYTSLKM